jgi:DNA-binding protein YbaB
MSDSNDLKLDALLSDMESMQDQLEKQHTQLETLRTENYKALKTVSDLSSENSMLRSELQKKSDTIVSLNKKLKDQCLVEGDLVKSEEAKRVGEKALKEAETIRSNFECKQSELEDREAEIRRKEGELEIVIDTEAENRIVDVRNELEEEYKRKEEHIWHMSQLREQATADKYKKLTIRYQVEFTILLFYGVIVTALKMIATPEIMADVIQFFVNLWNTLVGFVVDVIGFSHTVAGISQLIPNPTVAGIVFWVLQILISVIVIGIVYLTIYSVIILYVRYLKANQFDRYTVIAAITVLAFAIFLANVIKGIAPVNLFAIQIGLFLAYSGVRALVVSRR